MLRWAVVDPEAGPNAVVLVVAVVETMAVTVVVVDRRQSVMVIGRCQSVVVIGLR